MGPKKAKHPKEKRVMTCAVGQRNKILRQANKKYKFTTDELDEIRSLPKKERAALVRKLRAKYYALNEGV